MNPLAKLIRADDTRWTRLHTANGRLCLHPGDFAYSLVTTIRYRANGRRPERPWLPAPALRHLEPLVRSARVFEFSTGMSTVWYARRCRELYAVEHDRGWYRDACFRVGSMKHVSIMHAATQDDYVGSIERFPEEYFDLIVVDGICRLECTRRAVSRLRKGGQLVVDNTDTEEMRPVVQFLQSEFPADRIRAFAGFPATTLHPTETSICQRV